MVFAPPPQRPPMPEDVRTARQVWWVIVVFGVIQLIASAVSSLQNRDELEQRVLEQGRQSDANYAMATAELVVSLFLVGMVLAGLALAAAALGVVHLFGRGKPWARTILTVGSIWLILGGFLALFSLDTVVGTASLIAGGATIVQGVLAGGALYLSYRPDSSAYFQVNRR
ncbi:hypothetical protein IU433_07505 [Nocardia puris]|nr:hypothetical protein [Nocardia puris]MBF6365103.1 hypothetical protein [Nocardia puris]MBF6458888.1 hypothetical protein [Nocardia puris]